MSVDEILAGVMLAELERQRDASSELNGLYVANDSGLSAVFVDGSVDLLALARSVVEGMKETKPAFVAMVSEVEGKPFAKVLWGDGAETYVHLSQKAELVHKMGRGEAAHRTGAATPQKLAGGAAL